MSFRAIIAGKGAILAGKGAFLAGKGAILAGMQLDNSATLAGICLAERFSLDLAACIYPSSSLDIAAQAL